MKTQTSKTRMWLSTLLLLPIIAALFYSFAQRVEKTLSIDKKSLQFQLKDSAKKTPIHSIIDTTNDSKNIHHNSETTYYPSKEDEEGNSKKMPALQTPLEYYQKKYKTYEILRLQKPHYINKSKEDQAILDNLFSNLGAMYFRLLKTDKAKVNRPIPPFKPYTKVTLNGKTYYKMFDELTEQEKNNLPPPPPPAQSIPTTSTHLVSAEQLADYNNWAKEINTSMKAAEKTKEYPIIKLKVVNYYKGIYDNLNNSQKSQAEPFPKSPPIPPPPPAPAPASATILEKSSPIDINGAQYYFSQQNGKTTYYDLYGKVVDINKIPPPPPLPPNGTPEQKAKMKKATEAYRKANPHQVRGTIQENGQEIEVIEIPNDLQGSVSINGDTFYYTSSNGTTKYYNRYGKEVTMDNLPPPPPTLPPPPPPKSIKAAVKDLIEAGVPLYYNEKLIDSKQALELVENGAVKHINHQTINGVERAILSKTSQK